MTNNPKCSLFNEEINILVFKQKLRSKLMFNSESIGLSINFVMGVFTRFFPKVDASNHRFVSFAA